jgi:hypothetical protein
MGWKGNERVWLRDFLPARIPSARVISYGYDSLDLFSNVSAERLKNQARVFLNRLKRMRDREVVSNRLAFTVPAES